MTGLCITFPCISLDPRHLCRYLHLKSNLHLWNGVCLFLLFYVFRKCCLQMSFFISLTKIAFFFNRLTHDLKSRTSQKYLTTFFFNWAQLVSLWLKGIRWLNSKRKGLVILFSLERRSHFNLADSRHVSRAGVCMNWHKRVARTWLASTSFSFSGVSRQISFITYNSMLLK